MNAFQDNLDQELDKRRTEEAEQSDEGLESPTKTSNNKIKKKKEKKLHFSFRFFFLGLFMFSTLFAALIIWASTRADATLENLENKLPSKTTIVKTSATPNNYASQATTIKLPDVTKNTTIKDNATPKSTTKNTLTPVETSNKDSDLGRLIQTTPYGNLPQIDKEKRLYPHKAYRTSFVRKTNKPMLSIIITQMGLSPQKTESIIENFPKEVSFSFSPYANNLKKSTLLARKKDHEVWLTLPLETKNYPLNDPGPSTLLVNTSTEKNQDRLYRTLSSTTEYVGVISNPENAFKKEDTNVNAAIKNIFERGLAFIDSGTRANSFVYSLADSNDYPYTQNDLWLDDNLSSVAFREKINQLAENGARKKNTILMLRPYPASLKTIQKFLNSNAAKQFELAPASAQLNNG